MSNQVHVVFGAVTADELIEPIRVFADPERAAACVRLSEDKPTHCPTTSGAGYECRHDRHWVEGPIGFSPKRPARSS